jgi:hypothetical protein
LARATFQSTILYRKHEINPFVIKQQDDWVNQLIEQIGLVLSSNQKTSPFMSKHFDNICQVAVDTIVEVGHHGNIANELHTATARHPLSGTASQFLSTIDH